MTDETIKPRTIRAKKETFDALRKLAEEAHFNTQGDALDALISLWEAQNAKKVMPEQEQNIDDFRTHMQALTNIYLSQLDSIAATTDRVRGEFNSQLKAQALTIENLQKELAKAQEQVKSVNVEALHAANDEIVSLRQEIENLKKQQALDEQKHSHELEKAALEKDKAILAVKAEAQEEIRKLQSDLLNHFTSAK